MTSGTYPAPIYEGHFGRLAKNLYQVDRLSLA
jgi:hypothetical protein